MKFALDAFGMRLRPLHAACALLAMLVVTGCAHRSPPTAPIATVERLHIRERSVAFEGQAFGAAGPYERIVAEAEMVLDPAHAANQGIADAALAAGPDGKLRYRSNVMIVRPVDPRRDSGTLMFEVANRGRKLALEFVNSGVIQVDKAEQAGTGWLMRQGHTLLWVGWQGDIALDAKGQTVGMALPVARQSGQAIRGSTLEEAVFDAPGATGTLALTYPAASTDTSRARLLVKAKPGAPERALPASAWRFVKDDAIEITRPADMDAGAIYQFIYEARDPRPMGLGMAAVRDVVSFLKSGAPDGAGQASPMAERRPKVTVALGISQSGRFLRDWIWQGFNADLAGQRVFDGTLVTIAGSRKSFTNVRWAQPGRYARQHEDHEFYGDQFPFTYSTLTDPVSGRSDGIFARCERSNTCPKTMHLDSGLEYWQARASLVVTDGAGKDVSLPDSVRVYLMASTQHAATTNPGVGICQRLNNPAQQHPVYRALMARLIEWSRDGKAPPASSHPTIAARELVAPTAQSMGFPDLSALGMTVPALNTLNVIDHGVVPPRVDAGKSYAVLVPRVDGDGLDRSGIRLPDVAVPLATYTGWNQRREGFAPGQLCGLNGSMLPFAATAAERAQRRDPRPSVAERYATRADYLQRVRTRAEALRQDGLLLPEDVDAWMAGAAKQAAVQALP